MPIIRIRITISKSDVVFLSMWAMHRDPRYWESPLSSSQSVFQLKIEKSSIDMFIFLKSSVIINRSGIKINAVRVPINNPQASASVIGNRTGSEPPHP